MKGLLGKAWRRWKVIAEVLGTVQLIVILTILYWTVVLLLAIPFKILAEDPLNLKRPDVIQWRQRSNAPDIMESLRKQG